MNQNELNRAIANVTGESVRAINRFGFSLADRLPLFEADDLDLGPQFVDWDRVEAERLFTATDA
jgi:hypothetical protein